MSSQQRNSLTTLVRTIVTLGCGYTSKPLCLASHARTSLTSFSFAEVTDSSETLLLLSHASAEHHVQRSIVI